MFAHMTYAAKRTWVCQLDVEGLPRLVAASCAKMGHSGRCGLQLLDSHNAPRTRLHPWLVLGLYPNPVVPSLDLYQNIRIVRALNGRWEGNMQVEGAVIRCSVTKAFSVGLGRNTTECFDDSCRPMAEEPSAAQGTALC